MLDIPENTPILEWTNYLQQVAPSDKTQPHAYLCLTSQKDGTKKWEILTKDQYNSYSISHPGTSCYKLRFHEIYEISKRIFDAECTIQVESLEDKTRKIELKTSYKVGVDSKIERFCLIDLQPFESDAKEKIHTFIQGLTKDLNETHVIFESVKKMSDRSIYNHQQKKSEGLLGTFQYYVWAWFFDNSRAIDHICNEIPTDNYIRGKIISDLKFRIWMNLDAFKEGANPYHLSKQNFKEVIVPEKETEIDSPQWIKKWLANYHSDKYQYSDLLTAKDKELADNARNKIMILMQLWEAILKEEPSMGQKLEESSLLIEDLD